MFIKSQFKDYYDSAQQYVYGKEFVWNRGYAEAYSGESREIYNDVHTFSVGFCGVFYHGIRYDIYRPVDKKKNKKTQSPFLVNTEFVRSEYFYDCDEFFEFRIKRSSFTEGTKKDKNYHDQLYSHYFRQAEDLSLFEKYSAPVVIDDDATYKVHTLDGPRGGLSYTNDKKTSLNDVQFERVMPDPNLVYASIVSFIDLLGREHKEVPEMDNDTKIVQHGFNDSSFRK